MIFIYGHPQCRAIDLGRTGVHDATDAEAARALQHVQCSLHVGADVGAGSDVGIRNGNQRRKVQDHILVLADVGDEVPVLDVACDDLDIREDVLGNEIEIAAGR